MSLPQESVWSEKRWGRGRISEIQAFGSGDGGKKAENEQQER